VKGERTIRNCGLRAEGACPRRWDVLDTTDRPDVRRCSECNEEVHFCATDAETIAHARAGHRIARERPIHSELFSATRERPPAKGPPLTDAQEAGIKWLRRELRIDRAINARDAGATLTCPECSYPVPLSRRLCHVCGHDVGRVS
jgi:hypothetical protein